MLSDNIKAVRERIAAAASNAGRNPADVRLIAVSKTHPAKTVREAIAEGLAVFGENKVREAEDKIAEIDRDGVKWHLIGHLQSNKARKAVRHFDVIHSLDSVDLAERLERICIDEGRETLPVLIQVDLAGEETKSGIPESGLPELVSFLKNCERLKLTGFMLLPPYFDDPENVRPFFRRLREIKDQYLPDGELSMGMSHDLETAVEEGATMIRIGTAIFGER